MRIGAFIVTFNRGPILKRTLEVLFKQTRPPDFVVIVDNGDPAPTRAIIEGFPRDRVAHQAMGDNLGPAGGASFGMRWLMERGHDWIYWGDDDNPPKFDDTLERLARIAEQCNVQEVGGVAAAGTLWDWKVGEFDRLPDEALSGLLEVDAIAGGGHHLCNAVAVGRVGPPRPDLFFSLEDWEYCMRVRAGGFRLIVDGDLMRRYRIAAGRLNLQQEKPFVPWHSRETLWRRYYSTRNYIHSLRTTFGRADLARREVLKSAFRVVTSWRRGPGYGAAFTEMQVRAVLDGYRGKMGRVVSPRAKVYQR